MLPWLVPASTVFAADGSSPWPALTSDGSDALLIGDGRVALSYQVFDRHFLETQPVGFGFHSRHLPFVEGTLGGGWGVSDHVDLLLPLMAAVRLDHDPARATVVWGGWSGFGSPYAEEGNTDTAWDAAWSRGLDHRLVPLRVGSLDVGLLGTVSYLWSTDPERFEGWPPLLQSRLRLAWTGSVDRLSFSVGLQGIYLQGWRYDLTHQVLLGLGSDQIQAGRNLPLVRLGLTDWLFVDGFASAQLRVYSHDTGAGGPTRPDDTGLIVLYAGNVGIGVRL